MKTVNNNFVYIDGKFVGTLKDWNWRVYANKKARKFMLPIPYKMERIFNEKKLLNLSVKTGINLKQYNTYWANSSTYEGGLSYRPSAHVVNRQVKKFTINNICVEIRQPIQFQRDFGEVFYILSRSK
jgi:hypothetical protein